VTHRSKNRCSRRNCAVCMGNIGFVLCVFLKIVSPVVLTWMLGPDHIQNDN
jgi:hypothetical protein